MLKVELHAHTRLDPADFILHTTRQLIDRAAVLGYGALAVTLHDRYFDPAGEQAYARARGLILIAGIERTVERRHLLLLNFPAACAGVSTFGDVRELRRRYPSGLVVAPHPFYPIPTAIGRDLERHADIIDALEVNALFTTRIDFNRRAVAWARAHGKPLVGNSDLHLLRQMGTTWTLVDAPQDADAVCHAIRAGRVDVRSQPLSTVRAACLFGASAVLGAVGRIRRFANVANVENAGNAERHAAANVESLTDPASHVRVERVGSVSDPERPRSLDGGGRAQNGANTPAGSGGR